MSVRRRPWPHVGPRRRASPLALAAALVLASCGGGGSSAPKYDPNSVVRSPVQAPTPEVAALAGSMSDEGRRVFYLADPKILDRAEFGVACPKDELTTVLGCYADGKIYILKVTRPELAGVMEVTAAHEMLHAAHARLSDLQRRRVDTWLGDLYAGLDDPDVRALIAEYDRSEPGQRLNELHSILPTEVPTLTSDLEEHYGRYFVARAQVVKLNQGYQDVLKGIERRIDALLAEVAALKAQLAALDGRVGAEQARLDDIEGRLAGLKAKGRIDAFNALVPQQNAQVRTVAALVEQYNQLVATSNAKVDEVNSLALQQNQLVDGLAGKPPVTP